ncbi:Uncharacterized protein FKW44_018881 [Caligus rogercresseyi]|uniref:Uncharacterized protein n=1 Tax=Caligus rogercresseyi TaxID=217165 RepID=A0A7T8GV77_CALRO|nr:Uncharacterized protein FKW44_018881 [Caligus rogercresseyi]
MLLRSAVVMAFVNNGGKISTNSTIDSTLGVNLRTVQQFRQKLEDTWDGIQGGGAARKVRDRLCRQWMKMTLPESMRAMSRDMGCHEKTIRDCVSEDLRRQRTKADEVNIIAQQAQAPKGSRNAVVFFSDKKISVKIRRSNSRDVLV